MLLILEKIPNPTKFLIFTQNDQAAASPPSTNVNEEAGTKNTFEIELRLFPLLLLAL